MLKLPKAEKSFWRESYTESIYPKLTKDVQVDVVIIGAGITGLSAAYFLKQSGFKVAVVDKDTVGGGTSGRTTGKVTAQHDMVYADMQKRLGTKTARLYGEANMTAVEQVESIIRKEKIQCDWKREDNYVFTADPKQVETFKNEAKVAAALGLPATYVTNTPLPFSVQGAVRFTNQAKINSQKYLLGLAKAVNGDGSYVFEHSNVTRIHDGDPGYVKTKLAKITARDIIVATNVPTMPLAARGTYCVLEYPRESYIVAGRLDQDVNGMYISPDKHHYSILPVEANGQRVLLIGGEGHLSGLRGSTEKRYQRLADYAEKYFGVKEIVNRWSDRDYLAYDSVPLVGKLYPWSKHLYVATGFKKWGLSNGTVAGMILNDLITGRPNPWTSTYDSTRLKPVASIPRGVAYEIKELLK